MRAFPLDRSRGNASKNYGAAAALAERPGNCWLRVLRFTSSLTGLVLPPILHLPAQGLVQYLRRGFCLPPHSAVPQQGSQDTTTPKKRVVAEEGRIGPPGDRRRSGIGGEWPEGPITDAPPPMELSTKALIPQDRQRYGKTRVGPQCLSSLQGTRTSWYPAW